MDLNKEVKSLRYIKNLDGVRGYAAIMVLLFHFFHNGSASYSNNLNIYTKLFEFGQHGVSLFFVLSGFVITRILIKSKSNNKEGFFKTFFLRRFLRIFPLYYFYLLLHYFLFPFIFSSEFVILEHQLPYYLYYQNFDNIFDFTKSGPGHFWSLAVEEHFYLFWPVIVYFVPVKKLLNVSLIIIFLTFLIKYILLSKAMSVNMFTFTRIDQIIFGSILAILEFKGILNQYYFTFKKLLISILLVVILSFLVYYFSKNFYFLKEMFKYTLLGLFFSIFLILVILTDKNYFTQLFFQNKFIIFIGKISYGFYVYHIFSLNFLREFFLTKNIFIDLTLSFFLTVLISYLSFEFFEKKFLIYKDKITKSVVTNEK